MCEDTPCPRKSLGHLYGAVAWGLEGTCSQCVRMVTHTTSVSDKPLPRVWCPGGCGPLSTVIVKTLPLAFKHHASEWGDTTYQPIGSLSTVTYSGPVMSHACDLWPRLVFLWEARELCWPGPGARDEGLLPAELMHGLGTRFKFVLYFYQRDCAFCVGSGLVMILFTHEP